MCAAETLKCDFEEALRQIDFSKPYDPFGKTFMKALFVGQMWRCAKRLESDVEEELGGAETYWRLYQDTGDTQYKEMASDELRHAGILIKKHYKDADAAEKGKLEEYENSRQEMLSEISKGKEA